MVDVLFHGHRSRRSMGCRGAQAQHESRQHQTLAQFWRNPDRNVCDHGTHPYLNDES